MTRGRADSRRQVAVAATAVVLLSVIGACAVEVHPNEQVRAEEAAAEALFADGLVELDLREPPSRADLALPEGVQSTVLEPDAGSVEVVVTFSDGTVLRTSAQALHVKSPDGSSAPNRVDLLNYDLPDEEVRSRMDAAVAELGVARDDAEQVLQEVLDRDVEYAPVVVPTGVAEPDRLDVELVSDDAPGVQVHYFVSWPVP